MFKLPPKQYQDRFQAAFKVPYSRFFKGPHAGFDIVAFDEWLNAGDRAVKDVIEERYGDEGVNVLTAIIEIEAQSLAEQ